MIAPTSCRRGRSGLLSDASRTTYRLTACHSNVRGASSDGPMPKGSDKPISQARRLNSAIGITKRK